MRQACVHGVDRAGSMKPVSVEVITYAPTVFTHCQHCELAFGEVGIGERLRRQEAAEALPDDLARDFQALSDWVHALLERHGGRVHVKVVDAASVEGFVRSLRNRVGRYPAVIVDREEKQIGSDFRTLDQLIDRRVAAAVTAAAPSVSH
jgi:hypothetical protein